MKILVLGNMTDWCELVYGDFSEVSDFSFVNDNFVSKMNLVQKIAYKLVTQNRIKILKKMLFCNIVVCKRIIKELLKYNSVWFFDWNPLLLNKCLLVRIRRNGIKIGCIFTNILKESSFAYRGHKNYLDLIDYKISFDKKDSELNGFDHFYYSYSIHNLSKKYSHQTKENDVFFVGNAKGRLKKILNAYSYLRNRGLSCNFYINGVDDENLVPLPGVTYNKSMSYQEVLNEIQKCSSILEIMQSNASTSTIRLMESITFDKFFITDNTNLFSDNNILKNNIYLLDSIDFKAIKENCFDKNSNMANKNKISIRNIAIIIKNKE